MSDERPEIIVVGYTSAARVTPEKGGEWQASLRADTGRLTRVVAVGMNNGAVYDSQETDDTPGTGFLVWLGSVFSEAFSGNWLAPPRALIVGFYPRSLLLLAMTESLRQGKRVLPHALDTRYQLHLPTMVGDSVTGSVERLGETLAGLLGREDIPEGYRPAKDADLDLALAAELSYRLSLCDDLAMQTWTKAVEPVVPEAVVKPPVVEEEIDDEEVEDDDGVEGDEVEDDEVEDDDDEEVVEDDEDE